MNKIILAGGSGFLGSELTKHFAALGWEVVILTRTPKPRPDSAREVAWDTKSLGDWGRELEGATAVVAFNRGQEEAEVSLTLAADADGGPYRDIWNDQEVTVQGRTLKGVCIPPRSAAVVVNGR